MIFNNKLMIVCGVGEGMYAKSYSSIGKRVEFGETAWEEMRCARSKMPYYLQLCNTAFLNGAYCRGYPQTSCT
jgi:hypothetical protein